MGSPREDQLADEGARLLKSAAATGRLTDREQGLALIREAFSVAPPTWPRRADLAVLASRALIHRWRTVGASQDLDTAVVLLSEAEEATTGTGAWPRMASELAKALFELMIAMDSGVARAASEGGKPLDQDEVLEQGVDLAGRALAATAPDSPERANAAYAMGMGQWLRGELDAAAEQLRSAVDRDPGAAPYRLLLARILAARHDEAKSAQDLADARTLLERLAMQDGEKCPREAFEAARFHGFWAWQREEWSEAADALLRALSLRESLKRAQDADSAESAWLIEAGSIPSQVAYALGRAGRAEEAVTALDRGLVTELAERLGAPGGEAAGLEEIQALAALEPIVYLVVTDGGGCAFVVGRAGIHWIDLRGLTKGALWERLLPYAAAYRDWQSSRTPRSRDGWTSKLDGLLSWLWETAIGQVVEALPSGVPAITVVTDGVMGLLPLHAVSDGRQALIDRLQVRYTANARALAHSREAASRAEARTALCVADPGLPGQRRLPYALDEVSVVGAMFDSEILSAESASLANVERSLPHRAVLHFACHGYARFDDPRLSGLVLLNGEALTLGGIFELSLEGTRLAVLSACESGMQDVVVPEEKASLPTGLVQAGVAGVIGSLWAVSDRSTTLLMIRLHHLWAREGIDPCPALRQAQVWLRDTTNREKETWLRELAASLAGEPTDALPHLAEALQGLPPDGRSFEHPFHWAAFACHGA